MHVTVRSAVRGVTFAITTSALLGACSVNELASSDATPKVVNDCQAAVDCGTVAGTMGVCSRGICVAPEGDISTVIAEVIPPAAASYGSGDSFLVSISGLDRGTWNHELKLAGYAKVKGMLTTEANVLGEPPSESCEQAFDAASRSLRVHVELSRSVAVAGLPSFVVAANATLDKNDGWGFAENVPEGRYDIYATVLSGCDADFPPVLVRDWKFDAGTRTWGLHIGSLSTLKGIVTPPESGSLEGWQVSLVEPVQGRLISTTRKLSGSNPTNFELRYQALTDASPLLRLAPPEETVAPEVIWDLSVLDLDGDGSVAPTLKSLDLSTKVHVRARVINGDVKPIAGASVRLRSTQLGGAPKGLSARYETVVTSDTEGAIELDILPGTYQVVVTPPDTSNLAITETSWVIGSTPANQAGRTVELTPKNLLGGTVVEPVNGIPLGSINVSVIPSATRSIDFLDRVLSPARVTPRVASSITDDQGTFGLLVDPGSVDMLVKPSDGSNFPWLARARVEVPSDSLGQVSISLPVPLAGTVVDPNGYTVARALMRVYALLDDDEPSGLSRSDDPAASDGVLQVAEGRTDEDGNFVLLLPSRLGAK